MSVIHPQTSSEWLLLAAMLSASWGGLCGVFERVLLAPRHRLSAMGPAYAPSMLLMAVGFGWAVDTDGNIRLFRGIFAAALLFVIGALPAFIAFHLVRRVLRTRFIDGKKGASV
jgi:hypothetical protein